MEDSGIDSDPKAVGPSRKIIDDNASDSSKSSSSGNDPPATRQLQRRLEKKIYDSKKTVKTDQTEYKKVNTGQNLIPIQRLSIPTKIATAKEQLPLVEWDTDESEEDVHFFPPSKANIKTELTDTFSVEEMEISADEDDLHLLPPKRPDQSFSCCPFAVQCILL